MVTSFMVQHAQVTGYRDQFTNLCSLGLKIVISCLLYFCYFLNAEAKKGLSII